MFDRHEYNPVYDYSKLRGRVKEKIGTDGAFAKALGRTANYMTRIFQNKTALDSKDILRACEVLEIGPEEIGLYFFTLKVH